MNALREFAQTEPLTSRALGPDDLDAVDALHHLAIGPLVRPEVVKPENRSYFEGILGGRGWTVGLYDGALLVAYGILQHDHTPKDGPHRLLGLRPETKVGRLAGASVHPAYRGRGLQRVLIAARVKAAPADMVLFSTAAPVNTPSWSSLLAEGFPIHDIQLFFGGYARYVLVRDGSTYDPAEAVLVDPLDTERQKALFAQGSHGYERSRLECGAAGVLFAPPRKGTAEA
ncbi:GNAT family N-acetyltransferase [Xanthobacter autotrophicus]|jgi:ribosomal protein S18 acetylase RimI-like enzyme|uniref:N-acetyltransferase domain-containing protein n=2 Tax=Xanthobacter autotrophicus TaxID=280 RepID=A0A6C1KA42_XANAU|nr:GNAT family N-acetyltransferase [Xanthobacter autotrophicus]TLX41195.1 hypothetical protein FBQ73_19925 [Xanthobacter autotrophicus]